MNCEEIKEILSSYIDGEARGDEGRTVERHLAECAGCRDLARRMRIVGGGIEKTEGLVPPGFREALFARMEREGLLSRRRSLFAYSIRWAAVPLAAAAGLALFLLTSREAGKVGPDLAARPQTAMNDKASQRPPTDARRDVQKGTGAETSADGRATRAQDAPERRVAKQGSESPMPAAESRVGAGLTPEERDIVAHLELLEDPTVLDEPSEIDELEILEPAGRGNG